MAFYPISKVFTVKDVISSAREYTNSASVSDILTYQEKLIYQFSLYELYNLLVSTGGKDYVTHIDALLDQINFISEIGGVESYRTSRTREYAINLRPYVDPGLEAFLRYKNIIALSGNYQFEYKTLDEYKLIFSSHFRQSLYRNTAIWTITNDFIYILFGIEVTPLPENRGDLVCQIIFNRLPFVPRNETEWLYSNIDLPDSYVPALFHRLAATMLYQKSGALLEPSLKFLNLFYDSVLLGIKAEKIGDIELSQKQVKGLPENVAK